MMKKFVNGLRIVKINEELVKDTIERITEFKKLKDDHSKWKKLKKDFIKQKNKIYKLSEDPNNFEIKIEKNHLHVNEELIRLFCTDRDLYMNLLLIDFHIAYSKIDFLIFFYMNSLT